MTQLLVDPDKTLDISGWTEKGVKLVQRINQASADRNGRVSGVITQLPYDWLLVRLDQFEDLDSRSLSKMYDQNGSELLDTKDRMYTTDKGFIMEVVIKQ